MLRHVIALAVLLSASPLLAHVQETSDNGFVLRHGIDVPRSAAESWETLIKPAQWWKPEASYSGDAANLTLDPRAGGCFCEIVLNTGLADAPPGVSAEHMRVVYVQKPSALRMSGAIGPLQAGAGQGTLTIYLRPRGDGTRILWEYVYGGFLRGDARALAQSTDLMLGAQLLRLGRRLGIRGPVIPSAGKPVSSDDDDTSAFARQMASGLVEPPSEQQSASINGPGDQPVGLTPPDRQNDPTIIGR